MTNETLLKNYNGDVYSVLLMRFAKRPRPKSENLIYLHYLLVNHKDFKYDILFLDQFQNKLRVFL